MGGSEFFEPGILYKRMLQSEKPGNTGMTTEFPPFEAEREIKTKRADKYVKIFISPFVSTGGAEADRKYFPDGSGKKRKRFFAARKNSRIKPGEKQPEPEEEKKTGVKR